MAARYLLRPLLAVVLLLAAGCASDAESSTDDITTDDVTVDAADEVTEDVEAVPLDVESLRRSSWELRFGGGPEGDVSLVDGWPVTLTFDRERLGGTAACNGYGASYTIEEFRLSVTELFKTDAGCEPEIQESERLYLVALRDVDGINLIDDDLALSGPASELLFSRVESVDLDRVVDQLWVLEAMLQDGVETPVQGEPATLLLESGGSLSGSTGCRALNGTYVVFGAEVQFTNFAADGECPDELWGQDSKVVTVLGDGFVPEVDGTTLTLTSSGNEGLRYRAADG